MTKVCYLLSHGFAARMVLQSGLLEELRTRGVQTSVLVQRGAESALQEHAESGLLQSHPTDFQPGKLTHGQLSELRRYFREPIRQNPALWSRHVFNRNSGKGWIRWRADLFMLLHRLFHPFHAARRFFSGIDCWVHRSRSVRAALQTLQPDLVVSTYPVSSFESSGLIEAQSLGIRTIGHLLSWDNITCKGRFVTVPDEFVSWGPIMTSELNEQYGVVADRVRECGVPHFDAHLKLVDSRVQSESLQAMGLDPSCPYLFFGMSSPIFAPNEIDVVEWLAQEVSSNRFGPDVQLVVRPHPQNVTGHFADLSWLPRIKALASSRVGVNMPLLGDDGLAWNMQSEDLGVLVNLIGGCRICLNSGSTLSIDALMHGKPVVVTFFDADEDHPWWKSAGRIKEFPHYRKLLDTGAVRPVFDFDELTCAINGYLEDPSRDSAERKSGIAQECGVVDGCAAERVANAIVEFANPHGSKNVAVA